VSGHGGLLSATRVRVGAADAGLTPVAGTAAVTGLVERLGEVAGVDAAMGRAKQRDRGLAPASRWSGLLPRSWPRR